MSETTLLLGNNDITRLTTISGNIDIDSIVPFIKIAQRNQIRRILTIPLYNKILLDFENDNLSGLYQTIYNDYVVDMLTYYSASEFIKLTGYKITNGGIYRPTSQEMQPVDYQEVNNISKAYSDLANASELMFVQYMQTIDIAEYTKSCNNNEGGFGLNWFL